MHAHTCTHIKHIIYICTSLAHIHKKNVENTHDNVAYVAGLDFQHGGNSATHTQTHTHAQDLEGDRFVHPEREGCEVV